MLGKTNATNSIKIKRLIISLTEKLTEKLESLKILMGEDLPLEELVDRVCEDIEYQDNVDKTLDTNSTSYTMPKGYYSEPSSFKIVLQSKTATLKTSSQTITPDSGNVLSKVSIPAIEGTAAVGNVLTGKTFNSATAGVKQTGTMPNNGAVSQALNCGGSYTIPAGYHNGSGKVSANNLSSQTQADAVPFNILSGKTAWINGVKQTGTMPNYDASSVLASAKSQTDTQLFLTIPNKGYYSNSSKVYINLTEATTSITDITANLKYDSSFGGNYIVVPSDCIAYVYNDLSSWAKENVSFPAYANRNVIAKNTLQEHYWWVNSDYAPVEVIMRVKAGDKILLRCGTDTGKGYPVTHGQEGYSNLTSIKNSGRLKIRIFNI